ncbi:protein TRM32-like isoform X2 [Nicotiana sylvestris]|uniref:Protein TRM32-like isoform X2 n=1 Tax=Nicotiana sylvestris TaxID=4096 RepID=A0A1U7YJN1_NICSY|nr:PREDICTED: protein TRM32-like isoform X2 [Nicotiana sylvestris]
MGKGLRLRDSSFTQESNPPGCLFGILHHLNHHHHQWHLVRKRLPHIRQGGGKHLPGDLGSNATATDSAKIPKNSDVKADDSRIVVKTAGTQPKSSIKSRLKALMTKELLSRKRVRHRRSLSYPARTPLEQTASIDYLDPANVDPSQKIPLNDETLQHRENEYSSVASLLDPPLLEKRKDAVTTNGRCELCAAMLDTNHLKQCDTNKNGKQQITDFSLRRTQSLYFRERTKKASIEESKLFLDALDLLNMREEVFLKILKDPNSSLAHQLHGTQASKGLTKSVSFPSRLSLGKIARSSNHKSSVTSTNLDSEDEVAKGVPIRLDSSDNIPLSSPVAKQNRHQSKLVLERFKNLRKKIRHMLKESSKEKRRIVMDAVLHKVPHDRSSSNDVKQGTNLLEKPTADGNDTGHYSSPFSKSQMKCFSRTSSLNESVDRYNRLLESCFSREEKQHSSEMSSLRASRSPSPARSRPIVLDRILSLPDLRNYPSFRIEDTPEASYSETQDTAASAESSNNLKLKSLDFIPLGSEKQTKQDFSSDSKIPEEFVDVNETSNDLEENFFSVECNTEDTSSPNSKLDKPIPIPLPDMKFQEANTVPEELSATEDISENALDTDEEGLSANEQKKSLLQVQVDERNKAEFNYVKDVLELSGFSGNIFMMNPSVFEEMDGCLLSQPESSGYAEYGSCDQLLLFDLINEVLLQLYERSSLYWPMSLTTRSFIHPTPVAYHLLEEVWTGISWCLSFKLENDLSLDDAMSHDLAKHDNWVNLQFDAECVGLELEDLIFDDLLDEIIFIDIY